MSEREPGTRDIGACELAERAAELGIPIDADPELLRCLTRADAGDEMPAEGYAAVAAILAFLQHVGRG